MKNRNGFISTTLTFTFFITFLLLLTFILMGYSNKRTMLDKFKSKIKEELGDSSEVVISTPIIPSGP